MKIELEPDEAISLIVLLKSVEFPNTATIPCPTVPKKDETVAEMKDFLNSIFHLDD